MAKKIAVVLSGCGNKDGAEITEAVSLMIGLSQAGASITYFAPDLEFTPKNFLTDQVLHEKRNVMVEAARISRSRINPLNALAAADFDGIALPGGQGAAFHLCSWARDGARAKVLPDLQKALLDFHSQSKPIGAICIAPVIVACVLGKKNVTVTVGQDAATIQEVLKTGAQHEECPVDDYITDRLHKIVTTPAYMFGSALPHQIFKGISGLVREFIEMA